MPRRPSLNGIRACDGIGRHAGFRSCHLSEGFSGRTIIIIKTAGAKHGLIYGGVVELVDSKDLGSFVERRAGSSPAARTKPK